MAAVIAGQWTLASGWTYLQNLSEVSAKPGVTHAIRDIYDKELRKQWDRRTMSRYPDFDVDVAVNRTGEEVFGPVQISVWLLAA